MTETIIINIGRQYGSGGREIGKKIAKALNFSFYDYELLLLAAKESGLQPDIFERADEKQRFSFLSGLLGLRAGITADEYSKNYLNNENLFQIQSDVIRELATRQSSVCVGRCADYVLRDHPHLINIFISANWEDRVTRVAERMEIEADKVPELIEKAEKKRAAYYNFYTDKVWGAAKSYDICLNSSLFGIEQSAEILCRLIRHKFSL